MVIKSKARVGVEGGLVLWVKKIGLEGRKTPQSWRQGLAGRGYVYKSVSHTLK
jgi:hypothetical protein